ncbi:glycosyltransferase [Neosynechococcus sphagnicola]|uniref:glycosyltransferase n=1 Tax=Neosynechococcus sphagnicola TaxID=1501145 RepID=UPI000A556EBA|nr:glycosyltransferase [Neosynechococcus sphagnicola]
MRILLAHNYHQFRGGDDEATEQEVELLTHYGHEVRLYHRHNDEIKTYSLLQKALLFLEPTWSRQSYRDIQGVIRDFRPEIVHFQGIFPLISPAAYYACAAQQIPVVQTLHDYRLLCPVATFFRQGQVCEACLNHSPWQGVVHACYRNSRLQTAALATTLSVHRGLKTWTHLVDLFTTPTEFARQKFIEGGLPAEKLFVRPYFLAQDPGVGWGSETTRCLWGG